METKLLVVDQSSQRLLMMGFSRRVSWRLERERGAARGGFPDEEDELEKGSL